MRESKIVMLCREGARGVISCLPVHSRVIFKVFQCSSYR